MVAISMEQPSQFSHGYQKDRAALIDAAAKPKMQPDVSHHDEKPTVTSELLQVGAAAAAYPQAPENGDGTILLHNERRKASSEAPTDTPKIIDNLHSSPNSQQNNETAGYLPRRDSVPSDDAVGTDQQPLAGGVDSLPILPDYVRNKDIKKDLPLICHVQDCGASLANQPEYYQRYRICRTHLRSLALLVDGVPQRFCQQCGRFHELAAFDGDKRNCRQRLEQHNMRRRKYTDMNKRRAREEEDEMDRDDWRRQERMRVSYDEQALAAQTLAGGFPSEQNMQALLARYSSAPPAAATTVSPRQPQQSLPILPSETGHRGPWTIPSHPLGVQNNNTINNHHQMTLQRQLEGQGLPPGAVQALLQGQHAILYLPGTDQTLNIGGAEMASLMGSGALQINGINQQQQQQQQQQHNDYHQGYQQHQHPGQGGGGFRPVGGGGGGMMNMQHQNVGFRPPAVTTQHHHNQYGQAYGNGGGFSFNANNNNGGNNAVMMPVIPSVPIGRNASPAPARASSGVQNGLGGNVDGTEALMNMLQGVLPQLQQEMLHGGGRGATVEGVMAAAAALMGQDGTGDAQQQLQQLLQMMGSGNVGTNSF